MKTQFMQKVVVRRGRTGFACSFITSVVLLFAMFQAGAAQKPDIRLGSLDPTEPRASLTNPAQKQSSSAERSKGAPAMHAVTEVKIERDGEDLVVCITVDGPVAPQEVLSN